MAPRYARKLRFGRYRKKRTNKPRARVYKRNFALANRAFRIARNLSRKVAGEVCKWQVTPASFTNVPISLNEAQTAFDVYTNYPLSKIESGNAWIMPLNWFYSGSTTQGESHTPIDHNIYINGQEIAPDDNSEALINQLTPVSVKNPIWYNTLTSLGILGASDASAKDGTQFQYRLAYIYIRGIFNASLSETTTNTDGAARFVIVKDKQPAAGTLRWYNEDFRTNSVFTSNLIDAQLNPETLGRFKIIYDKTKYFTTINGYKVFKFFRRLSTTVRNSRTFTQVENLDMSGNATNLGYSSVDIAPPIIKNAYYLMIFTDGLEFTYSENSTTPAQGFHLFNRVGYYNN